MKNIRYFAQKYVDWVIRLGRVRFSLLGLIVLAIWALCTQVVFSLIFIGEINWLDLVRSIVFGLISAPFVIYFFTVLVEKLEYSRQGLAGLVSNLRNEVSDRIAAERKLSVALDNIEQTSRDKTRLMATISHELRTPLNGIIGLSRILLDEELTEKQRNYLKTINVSAVSLGHIFSDIIDLEKIDTKRIELDVKATELSALLNDIGNFANLMAAQKHLHFELIAQPHLPDWIMIDYARLSQILWNLISNAVKFTPKGKVSLRVYALEAEKQLIFQVSDTGVGIPLLEQSKIFNMYYQVQSPEYKPLGSGIGLAVAKTIAQLMGGDLQVESQVAQGTTFTLNIPLQNAVPHNQTVKKLPSQLHILLVEDIEVNVIVAKSVLEKLGYLVDVAMTGREAIKKFEQKFYDLVLLDIQLPDISGFAVAQQLRANYEQGIYDALPPLVALTANVMSNKIDYQSKGMDDVLRKPLALEELSAVLSAYFSDMEQFDLPLTNKVEDKQDMRFDETMLNELIEILGIQAVKNNLAVFQQTMPAYIDELQRSYSQYQQQPSEIALLRGMAHKIKGALSAVGLRRLQHIAAQAQDEHNPHWQQNIGDWVEILSRDWAEEAQALMLWLAQKH